ncbi:hypothetical protein F4818DRAFT_233073 [Hypoxylon cercidicola]|nr:hypothetical protein F4818DRAFT_233073 [Hypoxylon cercidicola]
MPVVFYLPVVGFCLHSILIAPSSTVCTFQLPLTGGSSIASYRWFLISGLKICLLRGLDEGRVTYLVTALLFVLVVSHWLNVTHKHHEAIPVTSKRRRDWRRRGSLPWSHKDLSQNV